MKRDGLQPLLQDSDYLKAVAYTVDEVLERNEACRECKYKKLCMGGCRAITKLLSDDYLGNDLSKRLYFKKGYMRKTDEVFAHVAEKSGIKYRNINDVTE